MSKKRVSVVIPVFNEASAIGKCLDALLPQPEIGEIIVVDNNSTDGTRDVVRSYADARITVLSEPKQGLISARNAGLNAASGEFVARIDADTIVGPSWASAIDNFLSVADVDAGFGLTVMYDMPFQAIFRKGQAKITANIRTKFESGDVTEQPEPFGANMVLRQSIWEKIAPLVSDRRDIMEDADLGLTIREVGGRIGIIPGMEAEISGRRFLTSPLSYWRYTASAPATYKMHGNPGTARKLYLGIAIARLLHLVAWVPLRFWDPIRMKFDFRQIFRRREGRISPH